MTEEQAKKRIRILLTDDCNCTECLKNKEAYKAVVNILEEKDKEIEKKDKMIDLMADYIATLDIEEDICSKIKNEHCDKMSFGECEDCIKQYFKSKAEKKVEAEGE